MSHIRISLAAATVLGLTLVGPLSASAQVLKLAHFMPPIHPLQKAVFTPLANDLAAATNGKLTIKIYPSGALGKGPVQQYKRVIQGVADIVFGVLVYTPTLFPKTMIAGKPGIGQTSEEVTRRLWDIYDPYLKDEFTRAKLLALWANWPSALVSRTREVRSMADVKGMKIRTSSAFDAPQIKAWGGVPIQMPVTQTYNAMNNGVIDGVYIAPSALYRPWNLAEPGRFVTVGMKGPSSLFFLMMNNASWNKLSKDEQAALDRLTGRGISINAAVSWSRSDKKALAAAAKGDKITLINLAADKAAEFDRATNMAVAATLRSEDAKGIPATEIFNALTK
jgi:TRAP-type transport system periplasmic protein